MLFALPLLALAAPLFAQLSEGWFGLAPCALCLWQRWPYWAAAGLAAAAAALPRGRAPLLVAAAIAAGASGTIGAFHLGVEWGFWPSPLPGCLAPAVQAAASVEELLRGLAPAPVKPCDEPAFLIPGLPLSMAGMNTIYGWALAGIALGLARRPHHRRPEGVSA
ncbi:MAG: disulfide bond formation protein B [Rhodovarius sp.]|nr:disulfide bond formation protein B [Rhodovarius sp.]MDW8316122.1 disulfide bond formation protein B [Rhodovarius sp.]